MFRNDGEILNNVMSNNEYCEIVNRLSFAIYPIDDDE